MNYYEILLQKIRETPLKYLKEKSLKFLMQFLSAYKLRCEIEIWDKETNLDYFEHFDFKIYETLPNSFVADRHKVEFFEFIYFVHAYYKYGESPTEDGKKRYFSAHSAVSLITEMSSSEEEAFDKYFELRDKY